MMSLMMQNLDILNSDHEITHDNNGALAGTSSFPGHILSSTSSGVNEMATMPNNHYQVNPSGSPTTRTTLSQEMEVNEQQVNGEQQPLQEKEEDNKGPGQDQEEERPDNQYPERRMKPTRTTSVLLKSGKAVICVDELDNDSVSSLDSADSFADDDDDSSFGSDNEVCVDMEEMEELPTRKNLQKSGRQSRLPQDTRRRRCRPRSGRFSASPVKRSVGPAMPKRQPTADSDSNSDSNSNSHQLHHPLQLLQRIHSSPELSSPRTSHNDKTLEWEQPQKSNSVKSLNACLDLLGSAEARWGDSTSTSTSTSNLQITNFDNIIHDKNSAHSQPPNNYYNNNSNRLHDGDSSGGGTMSRWSASNTSTRTLNTAQLDQLSIVPRFPRRQRSGENLHLRHHHHNSRGNSVGGALSQDSAHTTGTGTPRKRPQLPNRQKSFRKGSSLTMDQAAKVAAAAVLNSSTHHNTTPSKPRRTKSITDDNDNNAVPIRQKSEPNLTSVTAFSSSTTALSRHSRRERIRQIHHQNCRLLGRSSSNHSIEDIIELSASSLHSMGGGSAKSKRSIRPMRRPERQSSHCESSSDASPTPTRQRNNKSPIPSGSNSSSTNRNVIARLSGMDLSSSHSRSSGKNLIHEFVNNNAAPSSSPQQPTISSSVSVSSSSSFGGDNPPLEEDDQHPRESSTVPAVLTTDPRPKLPQRQVSTSDGNDDEDDQASPVPSRANKHDLFLGATRSQCQVPQYATLWLQQEQQPKLPQRQRSESSEVLPPPPP